MRGVALSADSMGLRDSPVGSPQGKGVILRPGQDTGSEEEEVAPEAFSRCGWQIEDERQKGDKDDSSLARW